MDQGGDRLVSGGFQRARWRRARGDGGEGWAQGAWGLWVSQIASASVVRGSNASRPHVGPSIARPGEVQWAAAYPRPVMGVKPGHFSQFSG